MQEARGIDRDAFVIFHDGPTEAGGDFAAVFGFDLDGNFARGAGPGGGGFADALGVIGGEEGGDAGAAEFAAGEAGELFERGIGFGDVAAGVEHGDAGGAVLEEAAVARFAGAEGLLFELRVGDIEDGEEELVIRQRRGAEFDFLENAVGGAHGAGPCGTAAPDALPPFFEGAAFEVFVRSAGAFEPFLDAAAFGDAESEDGAVLGIGVEHGGVFVEHDHAKGRGFGDAAVVGGAHFIRRGSSGRGRCGVFDHVRQSFDDGGREAEQDEALEHAARAAVGKNGPGDAGAAALAGRNGEGIAGGDGPGDIGAHGGEVEEILHPLAREFAARGRRHDIPEERLSFMHRLRAGELERGFIAAQNAARGVHEHDGGER